MTDDTTSSRPSSAFGAAREQQPTARETIQQMVDAGLLDELMGRIDDGALQLTGEGGFLPEMIKAVLERGLQAELTSHLGYAKGDPAGRVVTERPERDDSKNGTFRGRINPA